MIYPKQLLEIVDEAVKQAGGSPVEALEIALESMEAYPGLAEEVKESLVRQAVLGLVHQTRHAMTSACKASATRVVAGESTGAKEVYRGIFHSFLIGGTRLGRIKGKELRPLAEGEGELAAGHLQNKRFLLALAERVGAEESVEEALDEGEAWQMLRDSQKKQRRRVGV